MSRALKNGLIIWLVVSAIASYTLWRSGVTPAQLCGADQSVHYVVGDSDLGVFVCK